MCYDLQDNFKNTINCKTHSSSLNYKTVNLGNQQNPQLINIGIICSPEEEKDLIKLCKDFKYVFSWKYNDLNTFDTKIMQHKIPMKPTIKPHQQKLRKMHPSLEPSLHGIV